MLSCVCLLSTLKQTNKKTTIKCESIPTLTVTLRHSPPLQGLVWKSLFDSQRSEASGNKYHTNIYAVANFRVVFHRCGCLHLQAISGAKCWILFPLGSLRPTVKFTAPSLTAYMCCDICSCDIRACTWKHLQRLKPSRRELPHSARA